MEMSVKFHKVVFKHSTLVDVLEKGVAWCEIRGKSAPSHPSLSNTDAALSRPSVSQTDAQGTI